MTPIEIGLLGVFAAVALIYIGLSVPIALVSCAYLGVWFIKDSPILAGKLLALSAADAVAGYHFGVIPLFVLLGFIVSVSGMGRDVFNLANRMFRRFNGGLGIGTVGANAIFAAITGISIASAAVFSRIAIPEMIRHGYRWPFAAGIVASSSVLGMLIPPSLLLILYAILAEQSVGDLFIAGIIPGLLLAVCLGLSIVGLTRYFPGFTGHIQSSTHSSADTFILLRRCIPIITLVTIVLGGIYAGFFTPIEASAIGCLIALTIAVTRKKLGKQQLLNVLKDTGNVTASVCFMIIAARMYSRMLSLSGLPEFAADVIDTADFQLFGIILIYVIIVILMGMILDSASVMLILLPIVLPIVSDFSVNLVWFGIVTVIAVEIGLITPPFGLSVFVIHSTLNHEELSLRDIFIGASPFILVILFVLALVTAFPMLSLMLLQ